MIAACVNIVLAILVFRFSSKLILNKASTVKKNKSDLNLNKTSSVASISTTETQATLTDIASTNTIIPAKKRALKSFGIYVKDFFLNAKLILLNRVYLFIVVCTTFETFLIKGFSSYLTKYIEYQYRLPASTATMIAGAIGFISLIGGALLGAFLIKHFKWHLKECARFTTIILFITSVLFLGIIIHCPQETYINEKSNFYLNSKCNCDVNTFYPVCYKNLYLFQTPCHAGCRQNPVFNVYTKCSVLNSLILTSDQPNIGNTQILSPCSRPASHCVVHLILVCLIGLAVLFMSSLVILPLLRILLESVGVENQSFALGIRSLITKLFGKSLNPSLFL